MQIFYRKFDELHTILKLEIIINLYLEKCIEILKLCKLSIYLNTMT